MDRILIAILLLMFIILGCSNRGATTIDASVTKHPTWGTRIDISGHNARGFDALPVATLNGETLQTLSFDYSTLIRYSESILWVNPGAECRLVVDYGHGVFEATELLPAEFRITAPDTAFVLYYRDDLTVNWDVPAGAEWYDLSMYVEYAYYDTNRNSNFFTYTFDTVLYTNTYTVNADHIFPNYVDSLDLLMRHGGKVEIMAASGHFVTNDDKDQLFTADTGWFNCYHYAERVYFDVGNRQPATRTAHHHDHAK